MLQFLRNVLACTLKAPLWILTLSVTELLQLCFIEIIQQAIALYFMEYSRRLPYLLIIHLIYVLLLYKHNGCWKHLLIQLHVSVAISFCALCSKHVYFFPLKIVILKHSVLPLWKVPCEWDSFIYAYKTSPSLFLNNALFNWFIIKINVSGVKGRIEKAEKQTFKSRNHEPNCIIEIENCSVNVFNLTFEMVLLLMFTSNCPHLLLPYFLPFFLPSFLYPSIPPILPFFLH